MLDEDQTELDALNKAEVQETRDTRRVLMFLGGCILLIVVAIVLTGCKETPFPYPYPPYLA